jgi:Zn-dependent oligopeptidase
LLEKIARNFRLNGLFLNAQQRKEHTADVVALAKLSSEFTARTQQTEYIKLRKKWLKGLPDDYRKSLEKQKRKLPLVRGPYRRFMSSAPNEKARKKVYLAWWRRGGKENIERLEKILKIRHRMARRLGYLTYAHLAAEPKMAAVPERIDGFLRDFGTNIQDKLTLELEAMRKLKCGDKKDCRIEAYDWRYYSEQYKKSQFGVDEEKLKSYLPVEQVVKTVFELYQDMFGLKFVRSKMPIQPWADAKTLSFYKVLDPKNGKLVGHFYLDIYLRDGKYPGAFMEQLRESRNVPGKGSQLPIAFVDAAFEPPKSDGTVNTMAFEQMETFFHEFGHAIHGLLGRSRYGMLAGTNVKRDFVETASQMLENWAWEPKVLKMINPKLPDKLIQAKIRGRNAVDGLFWSRQLLFAMADLEFHLASANTTEIYNTIHDQVRGFFAPEQTYGQAAFNHIVGGYAVGYYGYLWSVVISADLYTRFQKEGFNNPVVSRAYVKEILAPAGARDPNVGVKRFLGRDWNSRAFFATFKL